MQSVYVVFGQTGEYSDHTTWPVRAFRSRQEAEKLVLAATKRATEIAVQHGDDGYWLTSDPPINEHDPKMQLDYTGTSYYILTVELAD